MSWYNEHDINLQNRIDDVITALNDVLKAIKECEKDSDSEFNTRDIYDCAQYFLKRWG